jgi:hypothetical protein
MILFVSHRQTNCGIYQFGLQIGEVLRASRRYDFRYEECGDEHEYRALIARTSPEVVIHNHNPTTMPWLRRGLMNRARAVQVGIIHEVTQEVADAADERLFEFHVAADPTLELRNPRVFKTGRLVPEFAGQFPEPDVPTIGSFGFGTHGKGFEELVGLVQAEFDQAVIRLHIPFSPYSDTDGQQVRAMVERIRASITKPGLRLVVTHDFLPTSGLLEFLAKNSLNAFLYAQQKGRGISSVIDHALAVRRPIAISESSMFRHLHGVRPSVVVGQSSLREIMERGFTPLAPSAEAWTAANLVKDYERIVDAVLQTRRQVEGGSVVGRLGRVVLGDAESLVHEARYRLARSPIGDGVRRVRAGLRTLKDRAGLS